MRLALVVVSGLFCAAGTGCIPRQPDMSDYMFQQVRMGKPIVTEQGKRIDEAQAKNIQTGVHTKQDIEMWFGKAPTVIPLDDPKVNPTNVQDPHGCAEMWSYMHTVSSSKVGGPQNMGMETLGVLFKKDGKVCRWSLTRRLQDLNNPMSILGRPIDVAKTKNIQTGVQTKQDIETWFGKPTSIGFGNQPGDPKGCLALWEYQNMTSNREQSGGTVEVLRVKFNEQALVCHSDYNKVSF